MEANYCPHCVHCKILIENEKKAQERRRDFEEEQRRMEEDIKSAERRLKEEGVIYGNRYELYTIADIEKIKNYEFLCDMLSNIYPSAQPSTEEEHQELDKRYRAVSNRMQVVLIESLE